MATSRRGFVGGVLGGAIALEGLGAPGHEAAAESLSPDARRLALEWEAGQAQDKPSFEMSWVDRVTGQYRQVFDAPEVAEGTVFHQARPSCADSPTCTAPRTRTSRP